MTGGWPPPEPDPGQPYQAPYQPPYGAPGYPQPAQWQPGSPDQWVAVPAWLPPDAEPTYVYQQPGSPPLPPPYSPYGYPYNPPGPPKVSPPLLGWLLVLAALLSVLGAVMPWADTLGVRVAGTVGGGRFVIACAAVVAVCGLVIGLGRGQVWAAGVSLAMGSVIGLIGLVNAATLDVLLNSQDLPTFTSTSIGDGLWLTIGAALLTIGLSAAAVVRRRPQPGR